MQNGLALNSELLESLFDFDMKSSIMELVISAIKFKVGGNYLALQRLSGVKLERSWL